MKVSKLCDIKEFPIYVEHFTKFYLVETEITDGRPIPCVSENARPLVVYGNKEYNVYSAQDYEAYLQAKLGLAEGVIGGNVSQSDPNSPMLNMVKVAAEANKAALTKASEEVTNRLRK